MLKNNADVKHAPEKKTDFKRIVGYTLYGGHFRCTVCFQVAQNHYLNFLFEMSWESKCGARCQQNEHKYAAEL